MDPRFRKRLYYTAMAHVGLILLAFAVALIGRVRKKKPHEIVAVIDVQAAVEEKSTLQPVEKVEVPPPPEPEIPEPPPKPRPKLKKADEIEISKKRIRQDQPRPKPKKKTPSPDEVRKLLESGISKEQPTTRPVSDSAIASYLALVRKTMYAAWDQPSELSGSAGLMTEATIRVHRNGTISQKEITRPSGNRTMDESVRKALAGVNRLKKLPPGFGGAYKDIAIEFELTGSSFE
jgi:outer membrane biosynthesis protein TonB